MITSEPGHIRALVVTALALEREAVRQYLRDVQVQRVGSATADLGSFKVNRQEVVVAVIETGPGNIDAATATSAALRELSPRIVLMVGVAGGVKDVEIGDVVASRKVYWIEPGKQTSQGLDGGSARSRTLVRPDFGPVSHRLIQTARAVVADTAWRTRAEEQSAGVRISGEGASALVAPLVAVEKVVADTRASLAQTIRSAFSDAVAVAMEDAGALRAVANHEVAAAISIRGISDLLEGKAAADRQGGQELAAANAAAFAFELLSLEIGLSDQPREQSTDPTRLTNLAATLYPSGPSDRSIWMRAGGDLGTLSLEGAGRAQWWSALRELGLGGGGRDISFDTLITAMLDDYPNHLELLALVRNHTGDGGRICLDRADSSPRRPQRRTSGRSHRV